MGKRSIDFTKERTERLSRIANLMGISGIYGEIPKTIDFCVTCTEKYIELLAQVTPNVKSEEIAFFFQAVSKQQILANKPGESKEIAEK